MKKTKFKKMLSSLTIVNGFVPRYIKEMDGSEEELKKALLLLHENIEGLLSDDIKRKADIQQP